MIESYCRPPKYCYPECSQFGVRKIEDTRSMPSTYEDFCGGLRTFMQKYPPFGAEPNPEVEVLSALVPSQEPSGVEREQSPRDTVPEFFSR